MIVLNRRVFVLAPVIAAFTSAYRTQTFNFDLPVQPLPLSLRAIASVTGANLLFDPVIVGTPQCPAVRGRLSIDVALTRLLAGSDLSWRRIKIRTFLVEKR